MSAKVTAIRYPISNRYIFSRVFSEERNVKPLLEAVLGVPVGRIRFVTGEFEVEPSQQGHGVRMDVFVEDGLGTVYDVEMQNATNDDLRLRSRYLLSSFDRDRLARGEKYANLGKTIVIFICTFDPIGFGDRVYAVRPMVEGRNVPFDDGTLRVFLNASGAANERAEQGRIAAFLSYVDGGDTMGDDWVEQIDDEVRALNADRSWRNTMLTWQSIYEEDLDREADERAKVLAEDKAKEMAKDMAKDMAQDMAKGLAQDMAKDMAQDMAKDMAQDMAKGLAAVEVKKKDDASRRLAQALAAAGRSAEAMDALLDADVRDKLMKEFGIE